MSRLTRRRMLCVAGASVGGGIVALQSGRDGDARLEAAASDDSSRAAADSRPRYVPIAPEDAAARAYQLYPEGSCMYATIKSIVTLVAEKDPAAVPPFFFEMFKYGHGGCGAWGTLCGACNGGSAVMGLFHQDTAGRDVLIGRLLRWYETTELPRFAPAGAEESDFPKTAPKSVLCHLSVNCWCEEADADPLGPKRKERCRRLTADVAARVVAILNARHADDAAREQATAAESPTPSDAASRPPESCVECHSTPGKENVAGTTTAPKSIAKMECSTCHDMKPNHPDQEKNRGLSRRDNLPISVTNERSVL